MMLKVTQFNKPPVSNSAPSRLRKSQIIHHNNTSISSSPSSSSRQNGVLLHPCSYEEVRKMMMYNRGR